MSGWAVIANFLIPPPLLLTFLVVLPLPRRLRLALLIFIERFLSVLVVGTIRLVDLMLFINGAMLLSALNSTYIAGQAAHDIHVSPKEKITVLAKKWREERNFWIALMAFMCWAVLARFHKVAAEQVRLEQRVRQLEAEFELLGGGAPQPAAAGSKKAQ